jgi:hypothetical protein
VKPVKEKKEPAEKELYKVKGKPIYYSQLDNQEKQLVKFVDDMNTYENAQFDLEKVIRNKDLMLNSPNFKLWKEGGVGKP